MRASARATTNQLDTNTLIDPPSTRVCRLFDDFVVTKLVGEDPNTTVVGCGVIELVLRTVVLGDCVVLVAVGVKGVFITLPASVQKLRKSNVKP